jgi:cell division cycle 2-like
MSTSMSTAGASTPSRKRSKWDQDDEDEQKLSLSINPQKRRVKARTRSPDSTSQPSTSTLAPHSTRSSHSVCVPPRTRHPSILPSRSVYSYERLNQIEEGSYGVVFRARDKQTGDIVALKKLKLEEEKNGFPITALREINALMSCRHENVVGIREVVVGDTLTQYVPYI